MTEPEQQWSPRYGDAPGRMIRLWGHQHATYDVAVTKGERRRGVSDVASHTFKRDDGRYETAAQQFNNGLFGKYLPEHGTVHDTFEDGERLRFDRGWLVFEEVLFSQSLDQPYVPPWGVRQPGEERYDGWDDDARADGAAANMVYGTGR